MLHSNNSCLGFAAWQLFEGPLTFETYMHGSKQVCNQLSRQPDKPNWREGPDVASPTFRPLVLAQHM